MRIMPDIQNDIQEAFPTVRLKKDELEILVNLFEVKNYKKNEIILKQGEISKGLYILKYGSVKVSIKLPGTLPQNIKLKEKNLFFGEISLIEGGVTTATVEAENLTTFFFLPTEKFQALSAIFPCLFEKISIIINKKILKRTCNNFNKIQKFTPELNAITYITTHPHIRPQKITPLVMKKDNITIDLIRRIKVFNVFNDEELLFLLSNMKSVKYKKEMLLSNKNNFSIYFIIQGYIRCLLDGHRGSYQVKFIPPGGLIDLNYLQYFNNQLFFQATEKTLLYCLSLKTLNDIRQSHPSIYYRLFKLSMLSLARLFIASNHKISQLKSGHINLLA